MIRKLDESVINRIAAGEVVQRPSNALKEMLENSIDAKSTQITVTCKEGGMKLLQIQDNGQGIEKQDLVIVCERFTTSKLRQFEDLQAISTFGFRGEALASISHISMVSITSRVKDSTCAYKASYKDGKLVPLKPGDPQEPTPCAGNQGTIISVQDMFYNMPTRRRAFKSASEEYSRILQIMQCYSIENSGIAFVCKKEKSTDLATSATSPLQNISLIYGPNVSKELLEMKIESINFKCSGYVCSSNFQSRKTVFILFINSKFLLIQERLVEQKPLKKALEELYEKYLLKGNKPFLYLSLSIKPEQVDVNVHPTKNQVFFLNEQEIIQEIIEKTEQLLKSNTNSKSFLVQTLLTPSAATTTINTITNSQGKTHESLLVRTDSRARTLDNFYSSQERRSDHQLESVSMLEQNLKASNHAGLEEILKNHTFVGKIDENKALIQFKTKLFLVDYRELSFHLFYQLGIEQFSNYEPFKVGPFLISELVASALEKIETDTVLNQDQISVVSTEISNLINQKSELLEEYFGIVIKNDYLESLPLLLKGWTFDLDRIGLFLLRLGTEIEWDQEQSCLNGILIELAYLHQNPQPETVVLLFGALKRLVPNSNCMNYFKQLADLPELYKVFERC